MPCTYTHTRTQNSRIHTRAYTYTITSGSTETQEVDELGTSTSEATEVLVKVSKQGPDRMDGCAAHASMVIYTSRETQCR